MSKAKIAVIGAGLMGHGIAQVFALAAHEVTITDALAVSLDTVKSRISTKLRDLGDDPRAVERVRPIADLAEAVKDLDFVVEAVSEDLSLKQKLFAEIERHVQPYTILASNTSVIPITAIMSGLTHRERAVGTHWGNPPCLGAHRRVDHDAASDGGQAAGACEEGCAGLHRQSAAARALARGCLTGRAR